MTAKRTAQLFVHGDGENYSLWVHPDLPKRDVLVHDIKRHGGRTTENLHFAYFAVIHPSMSPEDFPGRYDITNIAAISSEWVEDTVKNLSLQEISKYCLWDPDEGKVRTDSEVQLSCPSSTAPPSPDTYTSEETRAMVEHIARNPDSHGFCLWRSFHRRHSQATYIRHHFRHKLYFDAKAEQHLKRHTENRVSVSSPPSASSVSLGANTQTKVGSSSEPLRHVPYTSEEKRDMKDFYEAHSHKYTRRELWGEYAKLRPGRTPKSLFWYANKHKEIRGSGEKEFSRTLVTRNFARYTLKEDQILTEFAQMHNYSEDLRWSAWEKFAEMHPTRRPEAWRRRYLNHILPRASRRSRNVGVDSIKSEQDQTTNEANKALSNSSKSFKERLESQEEGDPKPNKQRREKEYPDAATLSLRQGTTSETPSLIPSPLSSSSPPSGFPEFTDADLTAATEWIITRQCPRDPEQNAASWRTFTMTHSSHTHEQWVWYYYYKLDFFRKIEHK